MSEVVFDLEPVEREVTIGKVKYIQTEASEDAACKYRNASLRGLKVNDSKIDGFLNVADVEPILVASCLFTLDGRKPVALDTVRSWPARVVKPLFKWIKENSDLDEKPTTLEEIAAKIRELQELRTKILEDQRKKSLNGTTDTSDTPQDSE